MENIFKELLELDDRIRYEVIRHKIYLRVTTRVYFKLRDETVEPECST